MSSFVYEYEISMCDSYSKNSHPYKEAVVIWYLRPQMGKKILVSDQNLPDTVT